MSELTAGRVPQAEQHERLRAALADLAARVRALAAPLSEDQLRWSPTEGGWGVGQVLEHLRVADGSYVERLRGLAAREGPRADHRSVWKPSLVGGFLARGLEKPTRFRSPAMWVPPSAPRAGVLDAYLRQLDDLARLLEKAAPLDWRKVRTSSPVSRLLPLNLGDCFVVLVVHGRRHLAQMERVAARRDFPRA